jgi:Flp pilus assembly protein TadB
MRAASIILLIGGAVALTWAVRPFGASQRIVTTVALVVAISAALWQLRSEERRR